jgi:hypothetical protein
MGQYKDEVDRPTGFKPWKLTANDNLLAYATDSADIVNRYEIDVSKSGMLARYIGDSSRIREEFHYGWRQIKDVWLPSSFHYKHFTNSQQDRNRVVRFADHVLNEPLPGDTFSHLSLGMEVGDRLIDARDSSRHYVEADGSLRRIEARATFRNPLAIASWRRPVLIATLVLGIAIVALIIWKAKRGAALASPDRPCTSDHSQ